ncbi:hypothetical protein HN51_068382 [Arachis hypogaea]|uniref:B-like cyclin n=1 Tax=Arachis hypogaea TaxID=3818 RepID=A0A444ZAL3_ARAHY|nr:cyclin-D5-1 [Arachis ipaensis]XP_025652323.1 cyclin-D5-1-like [Arachis hypogaea]QHO10402.1 Cyclin [Arachis hypogaea]RYR11220.1 hypothetical protein Ahy_B05g079687 [Arachis hypogaea]
MGSSLTATSFSLSSLMCEEEGEACFFEDNYDDENEHTGIVFHEEDEEEYIEYLFSQETAFGFHNHDDCSAARFWLRTARFDAIDWIFNTQAKLGFKVHTAYLSVSYFDRFLSKRSIDESKPWAIQLLSVACLSLAAKMEEQNVPPLSEYPIVEYRFESKVIKNMELLILATLDWKMGSSSPTPFSYLHYFLTKFCPGSNSHTIITKATQHIVAMVKDVNLMDQRPSIIASAAILAAVDATLTRKTMDLRIRKISSWGNLESGDVFSCYNLIQEKRRNKVKTPCSNLMSNQSNSTCVLENQSDTTCSGVKRKLSFQDTEETENYKKLHRH